MQIIRQFTSWTGLSLTSLSFLYVALPLMALIHRLCPARYRVGTLLGFSLLFCLAAQPESLPLLALSAFADYIAVRLMKSRDARQEARRVCLWFSIAKSLALIGVAMVLSGKSGEPIPLGILVCALSGMAAVSEMYRRETPYELDILKFGLYCLFFPRLYAGPLCSYQNFDRQMTDPQPGTAPIVMGLGKFLTGAFKTLIIGGQISTVYIELKGFSGEDVTALSSLALLFTFALTVYFLLSGFGDMAQGIGLLFGYALPINFYYPYQSRGVADFFERFQITVTATIRRLLRGGMGDAPLRPGVDIPLLLAEGMLLGLWFGLKPAYLLWGGYLALFAVLEKYAYPKVLAEIPTLLRRVYALCIVLSSFTILAGNTLAESMEYARNMLAALTGGLPFLNDKLLYLLGSNWLVLAFGCFFATNIVDVAGRWIGKAVPRFATPMYLLVCGCILVLYTALAL